MSELAQKQTVTVDQDTVITVGPQRLRRTLLKSSYKVYVHIDKQKYIELSQNAQLCDVTTDELIRNLIDDHLEEYGTKA